MIFEDILKDVGGFGRYQKFLIVVFLMPASLVIPWFSMSSIFLASTPDHWCYVPEVAESFLSTEIQRQLISPPHDPRCSMYDIDYSTMIKSKNFSVNSELPTKPCTNGWQYDKTNYDATSVTRWDMVCKDDHYSSLVLSLMFVGMTLGTPLFGFMSDRVGRKPAFLLTACLIAVTDIGSTLSPYFEMYLILKTFNGLCITSIYTLAFIILLELVKPSIRARVNGLATIAWTIGMCILPLVAWLVKSWVYLSAATTTAACCLMLYWKVLPESPSWLISQQRYKDAHEILTKISRTNGKKVHETEHLMEQIQKLGEQYAGQKKTTENVSPIEFLRSPKLRTRFILASIVWISGCLPYYGHQVNSRNLAGNEFLNFFYMSAVEIPASLLAWGVMESLGRRWSAVGAFTLASSACFLPIIVPPEYEFVGVISALLAKAGTSAAYMTIYILAPELFPTNLRGVGMGLCSTIGSASTLIAPYIVYLAKYGLYIPFLCFAIIALVGAVCALFLPETLDLELPQTVLDVEEFVSKRGFCACGRVKNTDEPPVVLVTHDKSNLYNSNKIWIEPLGTMYVKKNSIDLGEHIQYL